MPPKPIKAVGSVRHVSEVNYAPEDGRISAQSVLSNISPEKLFASKKLFTLLKRVNGKEYAFSGVNKEKGVLHEEIEKATKKLSKEHERLSECQKWNPEDGLMDEKEYAKYLLSINSKFKELPEYSQMKEIESKLKVLPDWDWIAMNDKRHYEYVPDTFGTLLEIGDCLARIAEFAHEHDEEIDFDNYFVRARDFSVENDDGEIIEYAELKKRIAEEEREYREKYNFKLKNIIPSKEIEKEIELVDNLPEEKKIEKPQRSRNKDYPAKKKKK